MRIGLVALALLPTHTHSPNDQAGELLTALWYWRFIFPEEFAAASGD